MTKTVSFTTLGCKVNQYDTQAMLECFEQNGYTVVHGNAPADVYVVNTCTVTGTGDKKSMQLVRRVRRRNPQADVVLLGHSYGGSAIMDALRQLGDVPHSGKVLVVTLDPVSRRERSKPRERAPMVDYWVNAYCSPYRNVRDVAAWLGGPWGHCPQADENLAYSGRQRDEDGDRFAHVYPEPLLMEKAPGAEKSPHELLLEACKRFKIGRK